MQDRPPPTWVCALVDPSGDVEAWATTGGHVTPAAWEATLYHSQPEAAAAAAMLNGHTRGRRDGRRWRPVLREAVTS